MTARGDLPGIAIHEAGHLLAAIMLGADAYFAVAEPTHGLTHYGSDKLWTTLIITAAGEAATMVLQPRDLAGATRGPANNATENQPAVSDALTPGERIMENMANANLTPSDYDVAAQIIAERHACRRYRQKLAALGCSPDEINKSVVDRYYNRARRRAYALLAPNWLRIRAMAIVMVRHGVLNVETAQEIIRNICGDPYWTPV